jgi:plasmid stabilization system protein ParE
MPAVRIAAPAARQIAHARDWWLENRDKAPSAFDDDLADLVDRLEKRPAFVGRPLLQQPNVRRVYLQRIRYYVYFRMTDHGATVDIVALWHGSRGDKPDL